MKPLALTRTHLPSTTQIAGRVMPVDQLLRSPASGRPCVHWRLRIVEIVAPAMELVHEVMSEEPFHIEWLDDPAGPVRRVQVSGGMSEIAAIVSLHREGTAGSVATARAFELCGQLRVEEMLLQPNELVQAEGILLQSQDGAGPFRSAETSIELVQARVNVPGRLRSAALLPWALGAGALLLGTIGGAATVLRQLDQLRLGELRAALPGWQAEVGRAPIPKPRWP